MPASIKPLAAACCFAALLVLSGVGPAHAQLVLIGEGVRNGFFTDTSAASAYRPDGRALPVVTNSAGRALVAASGLNEYMEIRGWKATRVTKTTGNPAFGYDSSSGDGPEGARGVGRVPFGFVNSGSVAFESTSVAGIFVAGDVFTPDFGAYNTFDTEDQSFTATLVFDTGEKHVFQPFKLPAEKGASAFFSASVPDATYRLGRDASSVKLSIQVTAKNQVTIDNVTLVVGDPVLFVEPE